MNNFIIDGVEYELVPVKGKKPKVLTFGDIKVGEFYRYTIDHKNVYLKINKLEKLGEEEFNTIRIVPLYSAYDSGTAFFESDLATVIRLKASFKEIK